MKNKAGGAESLGEGDSHWVGVFLRRKELTFEERKSDWQT